MLKLSMSYELSFKIISEIINLIAQIAEKVGEIISFDKNSNYLALRKEIFFVTQEKSVLIKTANGKFCIKSEKSNKG